MTRLRVASWNLQARSGDAAGRLGALLSEQGGADLVLLQESSVSGLPEFCRAAGLDWGVNARGEFFDLLKVRGRAGGRGADGASFPNGRAVAIAGRGDPPRGLTPFPDAPLPEKVMAGWVDIAARRTTAVSYHAPAGVTHGIVKARQAVKVAEWIAALDGPVILGGDFNTPSIDPLDDAAVRTHFHSGGENLAGEPGDDVLVGPEPIHPLKDALRTYLGSHPEKVEAIRSERPDGPLAVSHRTGEGDHCRFRYDAVWLSPHFEVHSVEYHYESAVEAGTDHALVIADVSLRDAP